MPLAVNLARHPEGAITPDDFEIVEVPRPEVPEGWFLIRNRVFSLDAGFRQWMSAGAGDNYLTGMALNEPVQSIVLGEVVESRHPDYPVGTLVNARTAWEEMSLLDGSDLCAPLQCADDIPLQDYMSTLGPTGMTAWLGLFRIGQPKAGECWWSVPPEAGRYHCWPVGEGRRLQNHRPGQFSGQGTMADR